MLPHQILQIFLGLLPLARVTAKAIVKSPQSPATHQLIYACGYPQARALKLEESRNNGMRIVTAC